MTSWRKFFRSVIQVEVLSEQPLESDLSLAEINSLINDDCSGQVTTVVDNEAVDGARMAKLLAAQGSDSEFFRLTEEGEDTEDV